jgi:hypothetical protein
VIARHTFANVRSEVIPQAGAAGGVGGEFRDRFPGFEGRSSGDNPGRRPGGTGGFGGPGGNASVSGALVTLLQTGASGYEWAATVGSDSAASMELSTGGDPVMAIGGFSGSDPAPALAEFQQMVTSHEVHYFVAGRGRHDGLRPHRAGPSLVIGRPAGLGMVH